MKNIAVISILVALVGCKEKNEAGSTTSPASSSQLTTTSSAVSSAAAPINIPQGIDVTKLDDKQKKTLSSLLDSLASPCNKPHSLRTSLKTDPSCKSSPHAVKYAVALIGAGATEADVKSMHTARYPGKVEAGPIDVSGAPSVGAKEPKVTLIEFFDYGCPACAHFAPQLDRVAKRGDVKIYYMMYPLESHPDSGPAAQAALAANEQGKFKEMHEKLFISRAHKLSDLKGHAKASGLKADVFLSDMKRLGSKVEAHKAVGNKLGVQSTPTLYVDGKAYAGPLQEQFVNMWIDEAIELKAK